MLRSTVVAIILTLTVGQQAALLCRVWCDMSAPAAASCHDTGLHGVARVADAGHDCRHEVVAAAFLREEVRRSATDLETAPAVLVPSYQLVRLLSDARPDRERVPVSPLERQRRPAVLRI